MNAVGDDSLRESKAGVVTFLDVLGWKGVYRRFEDPLGRMRSLLSDAGSVADSAWRGRLLTAPDVISISDTVVLLSECQAAELRTGVEVHGEIVSSMLWKSARLGLPLRGATTYGEYSRSGNVLVGVAVDEAAAWYEQSDWIGVHLAPSADLRLAGQSLSAWTRYDVPTKTAGRWSAFCAKWPPEATQEAMRGAMTSLAPVLPDFAPKLANTLRFLEGPESRLPAGE